METIVVAILSLVGTLAGSYIAGNKTIALLEYRLSALEKKVDKHNNVVERTYELEKQSALQAEQIEDLQKRG